jgi:hypothetical protein
VNASREEPAQVLAELTQSVRTLDVVLETLILRTRMVIRNMEDAVVQAMRGEKHERLPTPAEVCPSSPAATPSAANRGHPDYLLIPGCKDPP